MSMSLAEVEQAFFALDRRDRAALIHRGLQTLDAEEEQGEQGEQGEVDAAWHDELRRRIDDIENGKVELLDADEVHAQIRAELVAKPK